MDKYIGKFRVNQTVYLNFWTDLWETNRPENENYIVMRKGTILNAYELSGLEMFQNCECFIKLWNKRHKVYVEDLEVLYKCEWLDEVKEVK